MSSELRDTLKERLDANYTAFMESLQKKTASELNKLAPEITAAQQLHDELLAACNEQDVEFLLQFDDPLELVRDSWTAAISNSDHSEEISHLLWEIQDKELYDIKEIRTDETLPRPKMQLSEKEHRLSVIAGAASNTLRSVGLHEQADKLFQRVAYAGSYESALRIVRKHIEIEIIPAINPPQRTAKRRKKPRER